MEIQSKGSNLRKKKKMLDVKKKMKTMSQEQVRAAIEKKKLCNAKAMTIVDRLIEQNVDETWLLENLFYINQSHYQDAVEERAISKYCGYPLCDISLKDIPKKQYHISTKLNKVYDITDRKNYCSNFCYKASIYLKEQLFTSPLWLRDCEDSVEFQFFKPLNKSGSTGLEIDLGQISPVNCDDTEDTSISNFTEIPQEMQTNSIENNETGNKPKIVADFIKATEIVEKPIQPNSTELKANNNSTSGRRNKPSPILFSTNEKVLNVLESWLTGKTLRFLYGDDKIKEMFKSIKVANKLLGHDLDTLYSKDAYLYERYEALCKKLNLIEIKEKFVEKEEKPTKPLPDFETLKTEAKELEIKVKSFYLGDKVSFQNADDENLPNITTKNGENENIDNINTCPPVLPLIDQHCILAIRRKIVLDKMCKIIPDIQSAIGIGHINIRHEIQEFVHTLALTPANIVLSPSEWNLISLVTIKLFTLRNQTLDYQFNTDFTQKRIINLLLAYSLDLSYLQECILKLSNIEQIIRNS